MNHGRYETHEKLLYKDKVYAVQGAIVEVYKEMGCGYLEAVYPECLEKALCLRDIPFVAQNELTLSYEGMLLDQTYRPDIVGHNQIILELKAVKTIAPEHQTQLLSYLKATGFKLGLIALLRTSPKGGDPTVRTVTQLSCISCLSWLRNQPQSRNHQQSLCVTPASFR